MPAPSPATRYVGDNGWTMDRVATILQVETTQVRKYFAGHRRVSPSMKTRLVRELGDAAYALVEMCDHAWNVNHEETKPIKPARIEEEQYAPPVYDGPRYTIDEWVEQFGRPGCGEPDVNGRFSGCFDTEPCWLGE